MAAPISLCWDDDEPDRSETQGQMSHGGCGKLGGACSEKSSGNVFADLGLPHPEQGLLKSRLTLQIYRIVKARGLKQAEAGKILGIQQPHVSLLMRNRSGTFSVERLMEFLTALGQDVEITVRPTRKQHGEMCVVA
jgi:predicted XRE-type DNA-binding protein